MVVSTLDADRHIVYGGEIPRDSVFKVAIGYFTDAINGTSATGQTAVRNLARVGRARAYADLGQVASAKADAQLVDSGFVKYVTASAISARRSNRIWQENSATSDNTTLDSVYVNMNDLRVRWRDKGRNSVTGYRLYQQLKDTVASTPIRLATWYEARLIVAEADVAANNFTGADSIVNFFRGRGGEPTTFASTDPDSVKAEIFDQRRRELFLEGQHLGDVIRFGVTPDPPAGTPFKGGGTYGTQLCLPLPDVEKNNNPNVP